MRAVHFLERFHFINHIVVQTGFAEVEFMLAVAHVNLEVFVLRFYYFGLADLAHFFGGFKHGFDHFAHF